MKPHHAFDEPKIFLYVNYNSIFNVVKLIASVNSLVLITFFKLKLVIFINSIS